MGEEVEITTKNPNMQIFLFFSFCHQYRADKIRKLLVRLVISQLRTPSVIQLHISRMRFILQYFRCFLACLTPFLALKFLFFGHRMEFVITLVLHINLLRSKTYHLSCYRIFHTLDTRYGQPFRFLFFLQCTGEIIKTGCCCISCHNSRCFFRTLCSKIKR